MLANALFTPVPEWDTITPTEQIVWGISIALAAVTIGAAFIGTITGLSVRCPKVFAGLIVAGVCFVGIGVLTATRGHARLANQRVQQHRLRELQPQRVPE